ncbi:MAG: TlpA disulfide reductase family protein [Kofleriaceae bacterium]
MRTPNALLLSAVSLALLASTAGLARAEIKVGDRAPELDAAKTEAGKPWKLKQLKGWKLLTFGAKWCIPCAKELPAWDKLAPEFKGKVTFVAVNVNNDRKDGKKFHDKLKLKNLLRIYMPQEASTSDEQYDTGTFPSTFVIDGDGVIRYIHAGYQAGDEKALKATLTKLLGE